MQAAFGHFISKTKKEHQNIICLMSKLSKQFMGSAAFAALPTKVFCTFFRIHFIIQCPAQYIL